MDFELPQELKMVQSLARNFVTDQLKPLERDIMGRAADLSDALPSLPPKTEEKLIKMAQEMGLWGISVPEELGGIGLNTLGNCLVEEELAQTIIPFNLGDVTPVLFECNPPQREKYFLPASNRQKQPYLALMEPETRADLPHMDMTAEKRNGQYILNGKKLCFSRPAADYFAVVFATTGKGKREVTCFLVDRDAPGFKVVNGTEKTGWQTLLLKPMTLVFEQCQLTGDHILGEEGKAFHLGKKWLPGRRIIRAARSVGVAQRLLEEATTQAQSWQSFGQNISGRTSIIAALADIAVNIHASRLMVHQAAWQADEGKPIRREAAMVKLFTTQMVYHVADNVAHVFNAPPFIAGLPMERLCRHALATSATELALEVQRSIIARDLFKGLKV